LSSGNRLNFGNLGYNTEQLEKTPNWSTFR
jgi:hypothetical protein